MEATIFQNFRVTAARGFTQVAPKYRTRIHCDPTYRLEKEVLIIWSSRSIFTRGVSRVAAVYERSAPSNYLAHFAVDKYNEKEKANLKFVEVVDLKQYMGAGMWYHVTLKAKDGEKVNFYKARILEFWNKTELKKFKLVVDPPNGLPRHAVNRYNEKENANLKFVKCLHFKRYFVAGELYHITLEAKDGEKVNVYKAEVRERLYQQKGFLLTEFKLVGDAPSVDSEKFPECKSVLSSIFLNLKARAASIWETGFSQTGKSHKDLTTSTVCVPGFSQVEQSHKDLTTSTVCAPGFSQVEQSHKDLTTSTVCAPGFSQVEQSHKDLTTSTVVKKLNPIYRPTTDNLARFAVDLHNIKNNKDANLKFVKGIDSKQGYFYDVTLEAMDGEKVNVYQAQILDLQELWEFKLVGEAPLLI